MSKILNSNVQNVSNFGHLKFEFVSANFIKSGEIRISNLFKYNPFIIVCIYPLQPALNG